jgi:hypothetical protein
MRLGGLGFPLEVDKAALGWHGFEAVRSVTECGLEMNKER